MYIVQIIMLFKGIIGTSLPDLFVNMITQPR